MENAIQLANRFREVLLNGKWVANTNYNEQISQVTFEQAIKKVGTLNTIALLTYHINYYLEGVLNFFNTGKMEISDKFSFEMPPLNHDSDWIQLKSNILKNAENFALAIEQMSDTKLESVFLDKKYGTYRRNIEGMIEHCYYHLGQIVLIRKMINDQP
ncbi:MAG: DUF1572 domain-containing protein [Saprospiraceae bacterium]|nr:DUF1572 domain-containing protein [Bacteroidia bacterium]NNE14288.1 DUF1572 domain-containing protein [Saprospiraceae bacterium]